MKKIYFLLLMSFLAFFADAQTASTYQFTETTATFTQVSDATSTNLPLVQADTYVSPLTNIGFTFVYEGVNYTQFAMSSNGFISFGPTPNSLTTNNFSTANATARPIIGPLWDDLDGNATGGSRASYELTGSAPNRVLTVEWRNWEWNWNSAAPVISFQVKLYETTNVIEFAYRQESGAVTSGSASIGIGSATGSGANSFINLSAIAPAVTNTTAATTTISTKPATNTLYRFTPPVPCVGTPTPGTTAQTTYNLCSGSTQVITVTGATAAPGISYQWESSADGSTGWANVSGGSGATTTSYTTVAYAGTPMYYRLKTTCSGSGLSAVTATILVTGPGAPATQATAITTSALAPTTATITWTNGSGNNRTVYVNTTNSFTGPVSPNTPGTAATLFANAGQQLVYDGTGSSVSITGLTSATTYYVRVYEGQKCTTPSAAWYYNVTTATNNPGTFSTPVIPANDECATAVTLTPQAYVVIGSGCPSGVAGTTLGASSSSITAPPSVAWSSSQDDDVWYEFTATNTVHLIRFCNVTYPVGAAVDMGVSLNAGCAASNPELFGSAVTITGGTGEFAFTGLTVGAVYKVRVLTSGTTSRANFNVSILNPPNMSYVSSTTTQSSTATISGGNVNQQIVRLEVTVAGAASPLLLTAINASTAGSTLPADIASAKIYYTGTSTTFATTTQFGSTTLNPSGAFTINGSQALSGAATGNSTNYFWLVYDINCSAVAGDLVDAQITGFNIGSLQTPTVTDPVGTRTVVAPSTYATVADGEWNNPSTWACGSIPPTSGSDVTIANNVTVSNSGNVAGSVTITSAGTLTINTGGVLTLGNAGGGNKTLSSNGTLNVTGGILNINGNLSIVSGSKFNQSGGDINVDGNAAGVVANSVASGTILVNFAAAVASDINLTGGQFTIVDPHVATTATLSVSLAAVGAITASPAHTFRFGDGVSSDAGGTNGFLYYSWSGTGVLAFGKVILEGPSGGTNRFVLLNGTFYNFIANELVINNGAELRQVGTAVTGAIVVAGNLTVNTGGTLTTPGVLYFGKAVSASSTTLAFSPSTQLQTVTNNGTIRNLLTASTANMSSMTINNTGAGVTLASPLNMSGTLTLTAGNLNTTATNLLTVGVSGATTGTITRTAGMVAGPLKKWLGTSTGSTTFPVGDGANYKPAVINFTAAPTAAGTITARFSATEPNFPNAVALMEGALKVDKASKQGSWFVETADGLTGGTYTGTFTGNGATDIIDYTKTVLIKRPSAGGDWTLDGTHVTTTGSNTAPVLSRTGMTGFSEFAIGGENLVVLPIGIEYINGSKWASGNSINWKINVSNSSTATMYLERSSDNRTFQTIYNLTASATRSLQPFQYTDIAPASGINYYRLKSVDANGNVKYSAVIAIINSDKGAEIISIVPNPVKNVAVLNVSSAIATKMDIVVTDMSGRKISKQSVSLIAGSNQLPLNFAGLSAGSYQVTGYTADGQLRTMRFVKQ